MKVEYRKIDSLNYFPGNPRTKTARVLDDLVRSLRQYGHLTTLTVCANAEALGLPAGTVVGGNRRLDALRSIIDADGPDAVLPVVEYDAEVEAYRSVGEQPAGDVPCTLVNFASLNDAKAANVALNKIGEQFDFSILNTMLEELKTADFNVEITGFTAEEVDHLLSLEPSVVDETQYDEQGLEKHRCPKC